MRQSNFFPNSASLHNIWPTVDGTHVMTTEETIDRTVKMWNIEDMENILNHIVKQAIKLSAI